MIAEMPWPVFSLLPVGRISWMGCIFFLTHVSCFAEVHNNYCVRCHKSHWCYLPSRHIGCCSQWCWTFSGGEILGMLAWFDFWDLIPIEHAPPLGVFLRMNHLRLKLHLIATCVKWKGWFGRIMWIYNLGAWKCILLSSQNCSFVRNEGSSNFHWIAGMEKSVRGLKKKAQDVAKLEQVFRDIDETMQSVQQVF